MDVYLIALIALMAMLVGAIHKVSVENRRRKKAWAAYYDYRPNRRTTRSDR